MSDRPHFTSAIVVAIGFIGVPALTLCSGSACADEVRSVCVGVLDEFLRAPNGTVLSSLKDADSDGCWSSVQVSNARLQSLLNLVAGGSTPAAEYLAPHVRQLDGGNLEDSLVALGEYSERQMNTLLDLAALGSLSRGELRSALTMLPLALADKPDAQLSRMRMRRGEVERIGSPGLRTYQEDALGAIDAFIVEIKQSMAAAPAPTNR